MILLKFILWERTKGAVFSFAYDHPAEDDNHEAVVKVVSVEYHPAAEAPYPLDRIKRILRTCDEKKDKNLGDFE